MLAPMRNGANTPTYATAEQYKTHYCLIIHSKTVDLYTLYKSTILY